MNEIIDETISIILGDKTVGYYLGRLFFSFIAILLSLWFHSRKRDVSSENTPIRFSWYFLIWDNTKRAFIGLCLIFILFRFINVDNVALSLGIGFFVSFGLDKAIQFAMDRWSFMGFLKMDRDKVPAKIINNQKPE